MCRCFRHWKTCARISALDTLPEEEPDVEPVVPVLLPLVEPDADVPVLPSLEDVPGSALDPLLEEEPDVEPVVPLLATLGPLDALKHRQDLIELRAERTDRRSVVGVGLGSEYGGASGDVYDIGPILLQSRENLLPERRQARRHLSIRRNAEKLPLLNNSLRGTAVAGDRLADSARLGEGRINRDLQRMIDAASVRLSLYEETRELAGAGGRYSRA